MAEDTVKRTARKRSRRGGKEAMGDDEMRMSLGENRMSYGILGECVGPFKGKGLDSMYA